MATPINVAIDESLNVSDFVAASIAVQLRKSFTDSLAFSELVSVSWPTAPIISELIPIADSLALEMPQFITESLVMQEMVSSFLYSTPLVSYGISAESPSGVIPQVGSAIYTKWEPTILKETQVTRSMHPSVPDPEETGRERIAGLRHHWSLEVNVGGSQADTLWAFILSHVGAGIPFYFYDLQNNNFFYDGTGVSTNGRYMVRFIPDSFSRNQEQGSRQYARFRISYDVVEVGA